MKFYTIRIYPQYGFYFLLMLISSLQPQLFAASEQQNNCFIKNTIVDMTISPVASDTLATSPATASVARAHQGLYNDVGFCSAQTADKIQISYPAIAYGINSRTKKHLNSFWASKEHLKPFDELSPDLLDAIPNPIYAQEPLS